MRACAYGRLTCLWADGPSSYYEEAWQRGGRVVVARCWKRVILVQMWSRNLEVCDDVLKIEMSEGIKKTIAKILGDGGIVSVKLPRARWMMLFGTTPEPTCRGATQIIPDSTRCQGRSHMPRKCARVKNGSRDVIQTLEYCSDTMVMVQMCRWEILVRPRGHRGYGTEPAQDVSSIHYVHYSVLCSPRHHPHEQRCHQVPTWTHTPTSGTICAHSAGNSSKQRARGHNFVDRLEFWDD